MFVSKLPGIQIKSENRYYELALNTLGGITNNLKLGLE